jgi:hypothetical protein
MWPFLLLLFDHAWQITISPIETALKGLRNRSNKISATAKIAIRCLYRIDRNLAHSAFKSGVAHRMANEPLEKRARRTSCGGCYAYTPLNDDISPSADDYSLDLRLLGLGHSELVKGLLEIVEAGPGRGATKGWRGRR